MQLKEFQQEVLDTFDGYLDALVEKRLNALKPDFTEEDWKALKASGILPKSRADIPFSPRKDGAGRPVPSVIFR